MQLCVYFQFKFMILMQFYFQNDFNQTNVLLSSYLQSIQKVLSVFLFSIFIFMQN